MLNVADTPGDEGELFARQLLGEELSAEQQQAIKLQNDNIQILMDGQTIAAEASGITSPTEEWTRLFGSYFSDDEIFGQSDEARSMSIAGDGAIYITGNMGSNGFISKYISDGTIEWTRLLETLGDNSIQSISTADDGSVYITGSTGFFLDEQTYTGGDDAFIIKYNSDGFKEWTRLLGTEGNDRAQSISTADDGSVYITGFTTGNLDGQTNNGLLDAFIIKYNNDGSKMWTQIIESNGYIISTSISTSNDGSIYITGYTNESSDSQTFTGNGDDAFISKYNKYGVKEWTKLLESSPTYGYVGEAFFAKASSITTSEDGSVFITGSAIGNLDGSEQSSNSAIVGDVFFSKYKNDGTLEWTKVFGEWGNDIGTSIGIANDNSIYITGYTWGDLGGETNSGLFDAFISKYSINTSPTDLFISATTFDENITAGSLVAKLSSTDPDPNESFTYDLVSGVGSNDNSAFKIVGNKLKIKKSPNYELKPSYLIGVQTKDSGGLTYHESFTLNVNDIKPETVRSSTSYTLKPGEENLILTGNKAINGTGNKLNNKITGNNTNNKINGKQGAYTMRARKGNDIYYVDNKNDKVIETADQGTDTVRSSVTETLSSNVENLELKGSKAINGKGNNLNNKITGNNNKNYLKGQNGKDKIYGRGDLDILTGGAKADQFIYKSINDSGTTGTSRDVITDFSSIDKINLAKIDADPGTGGNQELVFIGSDSFSGAGQVRFNDGLLSVNTDDDLKADMQIKLSGVVALDETSLIL